ncbi:MAG: hypothetical protein DI536_06640 [Archangium gephyra]|uniref:non-specific serine/threonine protein kinase n=1 Tax=Archangium gephyra TaxID=48 RepID=A0A2W5TXA0_9BACT|nr:MAG: hypothetical protein DI536_06640 [Archangium gephyra]
MTGFRGTARYEIVRELGAGGMGVVYEAIDRERDGRRVALKVLRRQDPDSLSRLKREFRALAGVRHPNLAALYELSVDGDVWFFSLELIDGVDFMSWVRPQQQSSRDAPTAELGVTVRSAGASDQFDASRLEPAFRQLVAGVSFLHSQGRLHRDLKPSNVLVTKDGRVVILDFGLVLELEGAPETDDGSIVGTAAYMAPEQAGSGVVGAPADWYAVGVMLFQALTGRVPFDGTGVQVLLDKQRRPAPSPRDFVPAIVAELDALCVGLLRREPAERFGAAELARQFGGGAVRPRLEAGFVGRDAELGVLRDALAKSRNGAPVVLTLTGVSGVGKSALVRRFISEVDGVVLQGRCYERESVPYKALDSVIDALVRHLTSLSSEKVDALLPRDAAALVRMFPVLGKVRAFRESPLRDVKEATELRRRAIHALRELLGRIGDRAPLVVVIDDAQWGDADSAQVLQELVHAEGAPPVLAVLVFTREFPTPDEEGIALHLRELDTEAARSLAAQLGGANRAEALARDSRGNPFLLHQLAEVGGDIALEDVMRSRLDMLEGAQRRLLEAVALAASPLSERVAQAVSGLRASDFDVVTVLKSARLLRGTQDDRIEPWHHRTREAVVNAIDVGRAQDLHVRLADALKAAGELDAVAWHLGAAGLVERAADETLDAARRASRQLAFERAGVLFERALELMPRDDTRRRDVQLELAQTWAQAGRGADSARTYALAMDEQGDALAPDRTLELRRLRAEQLLRSGHIDAGLAAVREVLDQLGMTLAKTPTRAVMALLFRRFHIWFRGLSFVETPASRIAPELLQRIDACWAVSMGLAMVDTIRGAGFQSRQLLLALEAGEPYRVARALSAEAAFVATGGVRSERRAADLIGESRALADRIGDAQLSGLIDFCDGLTRFLVGRWREAARLTSDAEKRFADVGAAVSWEAANSRLFAVWAQFYLGDVAGLSVRIPALLRDAEQRGDRYAVTGLRLGLANVVALAADDVAGARASMKTALSGWSSHAFHFQHYWAVVSETMADLYEAPSAATLARIETCWRSLSSSQLLRIQNVRVEARSLMARVLLALGRNDEALRHARMLEREGADWASAQALLIEGLATNSPERLRAAASAFDRCEMTLFATITRLRLGEEGARAWLHSQGIRSPERFAQILAPIHR